MTPVKFIIDTFLRCKDMDKNTLLKELVEIDIDSPYARIHHETIVLLLYQLKEDESNA